MNAKQIIAKLMGMGLSEEMIAAEVPCSRQSIEKWKRGLTPRPLYREALARVYQKRTGQKVRVAA